MDMLRPFRLKRVEVSFGGAGSEFVHEYGKPVGSGLDGGRTFFMTGNNRITFPTQFSLR
jgi:hypothetical protein